MSSTYNVLIKGASYGSLLATKLLLAGHNATLVCTRATADLINSQGTTVKLPVRGRETLVEVRSADLSARLDARTPDEVNPADYDLVVLAMQEPQYSSDGVRDLLGRVAQSRVPAMAIMNMPPLPYLYRLPGLDVESLKGCYADPEAWAGFDPDLVTLASPDPQAFRPPEEEKNVLQVSLPTNFKVARFADDTHTEMLKTIEQGIQDTRFDVDGESLELPVKVRVHDSLFVPLAKWSMLVTGNYRCVLADDMRSIRDAVHEDLSVSEACYEWVVDLCIKMGGSRDDMVPFEKYAKAATGLIKPSSAARALFGGAKNIERVDLLVQKIAAQKGLSLESLNQTVEWVSARLEVNRQS